MPLKDKDDGAWYMDIVKTLAKKAGEEVARKILDEFGGPVGQILKDLIFGKPPEDLSKYLKEIDQKLSDVSRLVKEHYQFDLFALYNQADDGLAVLISAYKHSSEGSDSRKNACLNVLDKDGVFAKARTMAAAMLSPKQPTNKSVLQLYADFLIDSNLDVYAYRDSLFALASHLRLNLVQAAALREVCRREINDSSKEHDVVITEQEITDSIDVPSTEVLRPSTDLQKLFEEISTNEFEIRVIHCNTGKFLTGYLPGTQFTTHEPFDKYWNNDGMPQIFIAEKAVNQIKHWYSRTDYPLQGWIEQDVKMLPQLQSWKVKIVPDPEDRSKKTMLFEYANGASLLDGIYKDCVYLNPFNLDNTYMRWFPVLTTNGNGAYEPGVFILRHRNSKNGLEAKSGRAWATASPRTDNLNMKWKIEFAWPDTLYAGQYLRPGGQLVSANKRYVLRFTTDGDLRVIDTTTSQVIWTTHKDGRGAWRCYMQDDGNCVTYSAEGKPTWASGLLTKGSRAFITDDGKFVSIPPNGRYPDGDWVYM